MRLRRLVVATLVCTALLGVSVGDASLARDTTAAETIEGDELCLVTKEDFSISDTSIEVTQQTADPLEVTEMHMESHEMEDRDWLTYETDYMFAEHLCAQLSITGPGAVKVTLEGVQVERLTIRGPATEVGFEYGEFEEIELWISMKSALKLLPDLIGLSSAESPNATAVSASPVGGGSP